MKLLIYYDSLINVCIPGDQFSIIYRLSATQWTIYELNSDGYT